MTMTVLLAVPFPPGLRAKLVTIVTVVGPFEPPVGAALSPADAANIRVLATMGTQKTDAAAMGRLPNLRLICCYGSGYEGVDLAAARERGIMVTHSAGANAASVADHAMALLLAANRQTVLADRFVRDGCWVGGPAGRMPEVRGLTGRRIGVYGLGAIGRKIADRAAAFEADIAYHNRSRKPDVDYAFHETLQSLADWADILMVAVRADASNRHAVDRDVLGALGPDGIVVNITRGSVIDEIALIALLQSGQLGSAGLDVYEREPLVPEELIKLPQVVLAPHIGGRTSDAQEAMQAMMVANITAFLAGKPVVTPVPEMS